LARRSAPEPKTAQLTAENMRSAIPRLEKRIADLRAFEPNKINERYDPRIGALARAIDEVLVSVFGPDTVDYRRYDDATRIDRAGHYIGYEPPIDEIRNGFQEGKADSIQILEGIVSRFKEELESVGSLPSQAMQQAKESIRSDKIFIVHGHDSEARETVARFIERIGFQAVILHERPNKGRTIITKFREEAADIGFAVVLMTPDDHGAKAGEPSTKPRARQNVVFELGFFIGVLGPDRVAALVKGGIERPSDFDGVVYINLEDGGWRQELGRELEAAGYKIDWNKVMGS
jgi:predicted nucleotide-binding protein